MIARIVTKTILERDGFRFVSCGTLENGETDYRLQEKREYSNHWHDVYYFDNQMQCLLAMEDAEYPKWLTGKSCYVKDTITASIYS
jgi:hypothetical protein